MPSSACSQEPILCSVGDMVLFRKAGKEYQGRLYAIGAHLPVHPTRLPRRPVTLTVKLRNKHTGEVRQDFIVVDVGDIVKKLPPTTMAQSHIVTTPGDERITTEPEREKGDPR